MDDSRLTQPRECPPGSRRLDLGKGKWGYFPWGRTKAECWDNATSCDRSDIDEYLRKARRVEDAMLERYGARPEEVE